MKKTFSSIMYSKDNKCYLMESAKNDHDAIMKEFVIFAYKEKNLDKILEKYLDYNTDEIDELNNYQKVMVGIYNLNKIGYTLFCVVDAKGVPWYNAFITHSIPL